MTTINNVESMQMRLFII